MRYLIVGAGPAGVLAAETLRQADPDGEVTLLGGEPGPPYGRMAIPYLLSGKIDQAGTYLRKGENHFENLGIRYLEGRAERLSPGDGGLILEGGETIAFDRLLVATGSSPVKPPVPGLEGDLVHHCWTLADARAIAGLAEAGAEVVLMGGGFIGCIVMEALASSGAKLTVVEIEDRMVPRMMNDTGAAMIKRWCEDKGIRIETSARVTAVERDGELLRVILEGGEALDAGLLVVAAGVRPNIDFLQGSGVETGRGVLVDDRLRSNLDNVYAAGDVAEGPDFSTGLRAVHAVQPVAVEHGRIAAFNMAGKDAPYRGALAMNVLDTMGLVSCSFGQWAATEGGESAEFVDQGRFKYLRLEFRDDRLVGALAIGGSERIGVLRGLIQARIRLGGWKQKLMADPHLIAEAYVACAVA